MSETISWTLNAQIAGGPSLTAAQNLTVDAYDVINVTIAATTPPVGQTVQVAPGASGKVVFLLVTSNVYDPTLTFSLGGTNPTVKLDSPQLLLGSSIDTLLGTAPQSFTFKNPLAQSALITILVGRNV